MRVLSRVFRASYLFAPSVALALGLALFMGGCEKSKKDPPVYKVGLNFHLIDMEADSADTRTRIDNMVNVARTVYQKSGFDIGDVQVRGYTGADAQRLTNIDLEKDENGNGWPDDMEELLSWSANTPNLNLDIFLVRSINYQGELGILGIAGGIPGPVEKGTAFSGVLLNTFGGLSQMSSSELELQGYTMAHEADHYLGLYHTTERDGMEFDFLDDTPRCPAWDHDNNNDGLVSPTECMEQDAQYLMFWAAGPVVQDITSNQQAEVMRAHPMATEQ
ncbi:MAG: hypothetical protein OEZ32_09745 [Nitrospinota bacterium]|nr:hypothetical protein [Nitrospinota bacterium]